MVTVPTSRTDTDPRPRVAVLATTWFAMSHADVLATRLMGGYPWHGRWVEPRVRVVSLYLEQLGHPVPGRERPDIGRQLAERHGVPVFPTIGEALTCGGSGLAVDGVVSIAEHGDYELNAIGQQLYPHRRFFDTAVAAMVTAGRVVPLYNDKHLGHCFRDAAAMHATARRLGIPVLAGSTVPIGWRVPSGSMWPLAAPMTDAVIVGFGPVERYGIHLLEGLQDAVERRRHPDGSAGESGVTAVRGLRGEAARTALDDGTLDPAVVAAAFEACGLSGADAVAAREAVTELFLVTHADGLRTAAVNLGRHVKEFGIACAGPTDRIAYRIHLDPRPHRHWISQARRIESLMITGREPTPLERTLLTTGVLDAAMHSRHDGGRPRDTPELAIHYPAVADVTDTRVADPLPPPARLPDDHLSNTEEILPD